MSNKLVFCVCFFIAFSSVNIFPVGWWNDDIGGPAISNEGDGWKVLSSRKNDELARQNVADFSQFCKGLSLNGASIIVCLNNDIHITISREGQKSFEMIFQEESQAREIVKQLLAKRERASSPLTKRNRSEQISLAASVHNSRSWSPDPRDPREQ